MRRSHSRWPHFDRHRVHSNLQYRRFRRIQGSTWTQESHSDSQTSTSNRQTSTLNIQTSTTTQQGLTSKIHIVEPRLYGVSHHIDSKDTQTTGSNQQTSTCETYTLVELRIHGGSILHNISSNGSQSASTKESSWVSESHGHLGGAIAVGTPIAGGAAIIGGLIHHHGSKATEESSTFI